MGLQHLRQRVRISRSFAHFSKWYLGDGEECPWCGLCRRFPWMRRVIPYSYWGTYWCRECGSRVDVGPEDDPHMRPPDCSSCGGVCL